MTAARPGPTLLLAGGGIVLAALVWWGLAFWPTVSNDYLSLTEAGRCLVADSSLCRLAASLCSTRHVAKVAAYPPVLLWFGATVTFCGLWAPARRAH